MTTTIKQQPYKPRFGFFSLDSTRCNPVGHVKMKQLAFDIQRGVKRLPEDAFVEGWGSTEGSLRFMNALRRFINVQNAHRAELKFNQQRWYTLTVRTRDGFELVFKGVSGGFHGEGPRGCFDILKACGFNDKQCQKVWLNETFTVIKRVV